MAKAIYILPTTKHGGLCVVAMLHHIVNIVGLCSLIFLTFSLQEFLHSGYGRVLQPASVRKCDFVPVNMSQTNLTIIEGEEVTKSRIFHTLLSKSCSQYLPPITEIL
jgi:hypothetical protein